MWKSFVLTREPTGRIRAATMGVTRESELLSAAGSLCTAADHLRAIGLLALAEQLEALLALLDVEILISTLSAD